MELTLQTKKRILGGVIATIVVAGLVIGIFFLVRGTGDKKEWTLDDLKKNKDLIFMVDILFKTKSDGTKDEDLIGKYLQFVKNDGDKLLFQPLQGLEEISRSCPTTEDEDLGVEMDWYDLVTLKVEVNGLLNGKPPGKLVLGSEYPEALAEGVTEFTVKFRERVTSEAVVEKLIKSIQKNAGRLRASGKAAGLDIKFYDVIAQDLQIKADKLEELKPKAKRLKELKDANVAKVPGGSPEMNKLEGEINEIHKILVKPLAMAM